MGTYKDLNDYEVMYLVEECNETAQEILFEKYRPIILKMATRYHTQAKQCGLELEDLIQEGYIGLYNAIQNYNSDEGVLFYTYAILSIHSKILNCLKLKNARKHAFLNQGISLFNPISVSQEELLIDFIEDKNAILPSLMVEENELTETIKFFLYSLDFSQSLIFELKLNGFQNSDICKILEMPSRNVTNTLCRLRKKFRCYLLEH